MQFSIRGTTSQALVDKLRPRLEVRLREFGTPIAYGYRDGQYVTTASVYPEVEYDFTSDSIEVHVTYHQRNLNACCTIYPVFFILSCMITPVIIQIISAHFSKAWLSFANVTIIYFCTLALLILIIMRIRRVFIILHVHDMNSKIEDYINEELAQIR